MNNAYDGFGPECWPLRAYESESLTWDHVRWLRRVSEGTASAPAPIENALSSLSLVTLGPEGGLVVTPKGLRFLSVSDPRLQSVS